MYMYEFPTDVLIADRTVNCKLQICDWCNRNFYCLRTEPLCRKHADANIVIRW